MAQEAGELERQALDLSVLLESEEADGIERAMHEAAERQQPVSLAFPKRLVRRSIVDDSQRIVRAVVSTSHVDRYGTIINPKGIDTTNYFRSGAPVLWTHGHNVAALGDVPLGNALKMDATESELAADWRWANFDGQPVEKWGPLAKTIEDMWYLYRNGHLGAYSVTIIPRVVTPSRHGRPPVFEESELLEFSLTSVPVNPHATAADEKALRYYRKYVGPRAFSMLLQESTLEAARECAHNVALFTVKDELRSWRVRSLHNELREKGHEIQSLHFDKSEFTREEAVWWAKKHGFRHDNVGETENEWQLMQFDQDQGHKGSFGQKEIDRGVQAVLCAKNDLERPVQDTDVITPAVPDALVSRFTFSPSCGADFDCSWGTATTTWPGSIAELYTAASSTVEVNATGKAHAKKLIADGGVDRDSPWSFDAEDGNKLLGPNGDDWENYSRFHLGVRPGEPEDTKQRYAYPYGKDGKVFRRGVIAAKQRAAQQGHKSIEEAADELLKMIDMDREEKAVQRSVSLLPHIAARVFGVPLLIDPAKLEIILSVLGERVGLLDAPERSHMAHGAPESPLASYDVVGGVAVIPVKGTLVHRSFGMQPLSGMMSYSMIEQLFLNALNDPNVKAILLDVDSPGGEAAGAFDLADTVYASRGRKPIWAIADSMAFSSAYAVASAADIVVAPRTGQVGSIGVYALHVDQSERDKKEGVKYTFVHAGKHKVDGNPHEPLSESAKADIQKVVDEVYGMFVNTVARNRGLSDEQVRATEAKTFTATEALGRKLLDDVMTLPQALAALSGAVQAQSASDGNVERLARENEALRKLLKLASEGKLRKKNKE